MNDLLKIIYFLIIIFIIFILPGLIIISLAIVPITYIWAHLTRQSYSALCDSSNYLYRLNQFGKLMWLVVACISIIFII